MIFFSRPSSFVAILVLAVSGLAMADARAQSQSPQLPIRAIDPGRVEREIRPLPEPAAKPQPPSLESSPPKPVSQDDSTRFTFKGVTLEGATVFDVSGLEDLWSELLGKKTSLAEIKNLATEITRRYRNAGYILAQALVPAQRIENGMVTIRVVEGHVASIKPEKGSTLDGLAGRYAEHILTSKPLSIRELERWLLLINDLPGMTAKSVFKPSPEDQGGADLFLGLDRSEHDLRASLNNRAGPYYQDWAADLSGYLYNGLGMEEQFFARAAIAGDGAMGDEGGYRNLAVGLDLPLGARGLALNLAADHTTSVPGDELAGLGYEGASSSVSMRLQYPLERGRSRSLYGHAGLHVNESSLELQGAPVTDDNVRSLRSGLRLDWAGLGGMTLAQLEVSAGLDLFGASNAGELYLSRSEGDSEYLKAYLDLVHLRPLWEDVRLRIDVMAQISDRKLLSGEELGFGGGRIGRGFDGSEITGDTGAGIGFEFSHVLPKDLIGYGFYDAAMVANKTGGKESLTSAGIGLRTQYADWLTAQLELAKPLSRGGIPAGSVFDDDWRLFTSLSITF